MYIKEDNLAQNISREITEPTRFNSAGLGYPFVILLTVLVLLKGSYYCGFVIKS